MQRASRPSHSRPRSATAPCRRKHPITWGRHTHAIGDFGRAAELLRRNVEAADRESGTPSTDLRIESRAWLARTLSALGAFAEGRRHGEEALRLATLEGRGATPIVAHTCLGYLYLAQGDLEHAIRVLEQGLALCRASGNRDRFATDRGGPGLCLCAPGAPRGGARAAGGGDQRRYPHGRAARSCPPGRLAQRGLSSGGTRRGGLAARAPGARPGPAAQGRVRTRRWRCTSLAPSRPTPIPPMSRRPKPTTSRPWPWPRSWACARSQAHCHHGLGRLYSQTGRGEEARAELSAAIALYRAMDMTFWLPQAEAALAQVA